MTQQTDRLNAALTGRYTIERELGAGGMATVFLAEDLKHKRKVALKVLKPELGAVLGVERFLSEIKITANLQHPNLLPLFDSGEADGLLFYVMPFVEGETLRARIEREKQLPIDDAVRIATAVASALHYAHKAGVIHRDLKPENILLQSGQPVIADFGIALAVSRAGGQRVTESGLSLGTPQYMSPEQASADRAIDGRSDIYSLGALTYEMLTGEPPHTGSTAQAIISRIMTEAPRPIRTSRPMVPVHVEQAVHTALSKLPADRFSDAATFGAALQGERGALAFAPLVDATPRTRAHSFLTWAAVVVVAVAAAFTVGKLSVRPPARRVLRFALKIPASQALLGRASVPVVFTPDGTAIVYVGRGPLGSQLYYRRLDKLEATPLPGTDGADTPTISPSGDWVAFRTGTRDADISGTMFLSGFSFNKVSLHGGAPIPLSDSLTVGTSWGADDAIFAGSRDGLYRLSAVDGSRRRVSAVDSSNNAHGAFMPLVLPDGKHVLVWTRPQPGVERLEMIRIADGNVTALDGDALNPIGTVEGYLVFGRSDGTLGVAPFDPARTRSIRDVIPVLEAPLTRQGGGAAASLSAAGDLVYVTTTDFSRLRHLDSRGRDIGGRLDDRNFNHPRVSPDGSKIVVAEATISRTDLWVHDLVSGVAQPLSSTGNASSPEWTSDGRRVVYLLRPDQGPQEVWWMPADRSAAAERLIAMPVPISGAVLSPDDRYVVVQTGNINKRQDLYLVDLKSDRKPVPLERTAFSEIQPAISPDGRWLAYTSNEAGATQIYVRPFPTNGAHVQVTTNGGREPRWTKDSRGIVFRRGDRFEKVQLATGASLTVMRRDSLFSGVYADYDLAADGSVWTLRPGNSDAEIIVVMNWIGELKAKMAKK